MTTRVNRREFLEASAGVAAAPYVGRTFRSAGTLMSADQAAGQPVAPAFTTRPHKALIQDRPTVEYLTELKAAGFEGVEAPRSVPPADAEKIRAVAERLGMRIHSVIRGTSLFNSPDFSVVDHQFSDTVDAIESAKAFGADTVLLVPARIEANTPGGAGNRNGILLPRPWEFLLEWDQKGHVSRVVAGDNAPYADYIKAQNHAVDSSTDMVKRLIPFAEKAGIVLALENVWNNLWVNPAYFKQYIESFQSKWVRAYYDIGNHIKFGRPEEWILTLGSLIVKVHVKDYKLDAADPDGQGAFVNIRDGSVRWPIVRTALEQINYNGWMTIEAPINISVAEQGARLDLILAGK